MIDEPRQITGVIDMRVSDDHRIDRSSIERRLLPVPVAQIMTALKQAAIDQHVCMISFD